MSTDPNAETRAGAFTDVVDAFAGEAPPHDEPVEPQEYDESFEDPYQGEGEEFYPDDEQGFAYDPETTSVAEALASPEAQAYLAQQEQAAQIQGRAQEHITAENTEAHAFETIRQHLAQAGIEDASTEVVERVANEANEWLQADGRQLMAQGYSPDRVLELQRQYAPEVVAEFAKGEMTYARYAALEQSFMRHYPQARDAQLRHAREQQQ